VVYLPSHRFLRLRQIGQHRQKRAATREDLAVVCTSSPNTTTSVGRPAGVDVLGVESPRV
jgi:hypothetical protein